MESEASQDSATESTEYVSPQEFARLSGLSLATIHRYLKRGKLQFRQPGGKRARLLIPRTALEHFEHSFPVKPAAEQSPAPTPDAETSSRLPGPRPKWSR